MCFCVSVALYVDEWDRGNYKCLWDGCELHFYEARHLFDHVRTDHGLPQKVANRINGVGGFQCRWRLCLQPTTRFKGILHLMRHVRKFHIPDMPAP